MRKPVIKLKIVDPIYRATIFVQLGGDRQKAADWFALNIRQDTFKVDLLGATGSFFENSHHHGGLIWVEDASNFGVLVHEVLHATHYVLRRLRIELREDSEEVFCYYQEWLIREIAQKAGLEFKWRRKNGK